MDLVLGIFNQLGANQSIWYQLAIFVGMFIASKYLFFNHLQEVIEKREEKTVKLEGNADKQLEQVNEMSKTYKEKMTSARKEAKNKLVEEKAVITKKFEAVYREKELEINSYVEKSRKEAQEEIDSKKEEVFAQADSLANELVQKLAQR